MESKFFGTCRKIIHIWYLAIDDFFSGRRPNQIFQLGYSIDIHGVIAWLKDVRDLKIPDSGPKRKLLDAAERLIVEKGFDLVSVRDITGAVKANVAAVNYHFGSRENLMDIVVAHVMDAVNISRRNALEKAQQQNLSAEAIIKAYVKAAFSASEQLKIDLGFFLKLSGRVMTRSNEQISPIIAEERIEVSSLYLDTLSSLFPNTEASELNAAWQFFDAGLGQSFVNLRADQNFDAETDYWIGFAARSFGNQKTSFNSVVKKISVTEPEIETPVSPVETPIPEQSAEAVIPELIPAVKPKPKPRKQSDDQTMLFDL